MKVSKLILKLIKISFDFKNILLLLPSDKHIRVFMPFLLSTRANRPIYFFNKLNFGVRMNVLYTGILFKKNPRVFALDSDDMYCILSLSLCENNNDLFL